MFFVALAVICAGIAIYMYSTSVKAGNIGSSSEEVNVYLSGIILGIVAMFLSAWLAYRTSRNLQESYETLYQVAEAVAELLTTDGNVCYIEILLAFEEDKLKQNLSEHLVEVAYSCLIYDLEQRNSVSGVITPEEAFEVDYSVIRDSGWAEGSRRYYRNLAQQKMDEIDADEAAHGEGALDEDAVIEHVASLASERQFANHPELVKEVNDLGPEVCDRG